MSDGETMMKKTILLLAVLVGLAYYLHWFSFTTEGTGPTEHINITFDKTKIEQDEGTALRVLKDEERRIQQDASQTAPDGGDGPVGRRQPQANGGFGQRTAADPNSQLPYDPNQQPPASSYGPHGTSAYDPYDTNPPAPAGQGRSVPPRSAKRPPPSELDRGFE
jgi:hypothetical protein